MENANGPRSGDGQMLEPGIEVWLIRDDEPVGPILVSTVTAYKGTNNGAWYFHGMNRGLEFRAQTLEACTTYRGALGKSIGLLRKAFAQGETNLKKGLDRLAEYDTAQSKV